MDSAKFVILVESKQLLTPTSESQSRPLNKLKDNPEQQIEAWAKAVETAPEGKVTAVHVALKLKDFIAAKAKIRQRESGGAVVQKSAEPPIATREDGNTIQGSWD